MVTLAQFGLTTGFLLDPADDRRVSPSLLPQKQIFPMGNLCCQYTGCAWRRYPGFLVRSLSGHGDQDGCANFLCLCAFELIFSWRYQECILVSRFK